MTRQTFPKILLCEEMEETNKKWFEEFKTETKYNQDYYRHIEIFLKFRKDFLIDMNNIPLGGGDPSDAKSLNLLQLSYIREYNKHNVYDEYIFEILFQLGIDKQDLNICLQKNKDVVNHCFPRKNKEPILYNAKIAELLEKVQNDELIMKRIRGIDQRYLKNATEFLRRKGVYNKDRQLNYSDIHKSYEAYIINCPNCGTPFENLSKYWVLAKAVIDEEYQLVCSLCKGYSDEY